MCSRAADVRLLPLRLLLIALNGGFATDGLYLVTVEALGRTERKTLAVVK